MRSVVWNAAGLVLAGMVFAAPSHAGAGGGSDRLDDLEGEIRELGESVPTMASRFLSDIYRDRQRHLGRRYIEGRTLYEIGDYSSAAIVLSEVVEDPRFTGQPGWDDARYYLGESLFEAGELSLATTYFEGAVADAGSRHRLPAARRLLEIAIIRGRSEVLDRLLDQLGQMGAARTAEEQHELNYLRGQALYRLGRLRHAVSAFESVPLDSVHGERAAYQAAVIEALDGDLERARVSFSSQFGRLGDAELGTDERILRNLAALGVARMHYELENWDGAIAYYARVDRDAVQFDRALYELSWTLIREGRYAEAGRNLDRLAMTARDPQVAPEARLLKGETEMRLERPSRAVRTFQTLREDYQPIEDEVHALLVRLEQQAAREHVDPTSETIRASLSPEARQWMGRNVHDLSLLEDIDSIESDLQLQRELVELLYAGIEADRQIDHFPQLREGWNLAIEHRMKLVSAQAELLDLEAAVLWDRLLDRERDLLMSLQGERSRLSREYARIPRDAGAIQARQSQRAERRREAEIQLMRLEQQLQSDLIRIDLLEARLREGSSSGEVPPDELELLQSRLVAQRSELDRRRAEVARLEGRVAELRREEISGSGVRRSEREVVSNYESAILRERLFLEQFRRRLAIGPGETAASRPELESIAALESERRLAATDATGLLETARELEVMINVLEREGRLTPERATRLRSDLVSVVADLERAGGELDGEISMLLERERESLMRDTRLGEIEFARLLEATSDEMVVRRRGALDPEVVEQRQTRLQRIDGLRSEVSRVSAELADFHDRAREVIDQEGERWREEIGRAEVELARLEEMYRTTESRARIEAANQALGALRQLHGRFEDVNLRASLGLLDVSWTLSEDAAARRDLLLRERNQALRILGSDFAEILED